MVGAGPPRRGGPDAQYANVMTATVLLVEDEILIADRIARYLERDGAYRVVGPAIDFAEACALFERERPDLALLDIRLAGPDSGIDFARWLRERSPETVVVYLTSQFDDDHVARAKETFPAGYLTKPIQAPTLLTTVAVALHRRRAPAPAPRSTRGQFRLTDLNSATHVLSPARVAFLRADHVYVEYHLTGGAVLTARHALREAFERLPASDFAYVHRSYVVNLAYVTAWTATTVTVDGEVLPVSRQRRGEVAQRIEATDRGPADDAAQGVE